MASKVILDTLADAVTHKPPFCTGTVPTTSVESTLFYKQGAASSWLDLSNATEPELEALAYACAPATFGRNKEDVLDESYRKAGKMDLEDFAIKLNIENLGITNRICAQMLDAADADKIIRAEMYKLNVYEKGSFFKSHKDTPRGDRMFGSLVIVFPTPHKGGTLVLRHFGQEWNFDSATLTSEQEVPSVAYIAFYSDVDHEVTVVESGFRVTVTYNLFFESKAIASQVHPSATPVAPDYHLLHNALSTALENPEFLPTGGYLGFGLSFQYPVQSTMSADQRSALVASLKGSDSVIYRVCEQLSLKTSLNAVYDTDGHQVLVSVERMPNITGRLIDDYMVDILTEWKGSGRIIHEFGKERPEVHSYLYPRRHKEPTVKLVWVTPLTKYSKWGSDYIAHGNEASAACIYADLCIAVKVGRFGSRSTNDDEEDE